MVTVPRDIRNPKAIPLDVLDDEHTLIIRSNLNRDSLNFLSVFGVDVERLVESGDIGFDLWPWYSVAILVDDFSIKTDWNVVFEGFFVGIFKLLFGIRFIFRAISTSFFAG